MSRSDIADWDRVATQYSETGPQLRFFNCVEKYLWESLGELKGKRILDLGGGDGWLANMCAERGAKSFVVDGSTKLLEIGETQHPNVEFHEADLTQGLPCLGQFDSVISYMVLMDLPTIDKVLTDARKLLNKNGNLVFVILHPCFFHFPSEFDETTMKGYRKVDRYLKEEVWRLDSFGGHNHYHRSITEYCESLRKAGFVVSRLVEPEHQPLRIDCEFYRNIPILLFIEAKPSDL